MCVCVYESVCVRVCACLRARACVCVCEGVCVCLCVRACVFWLLVLSVRSVCVCVSNKYQHSEYTNECVSSMTFGTVNIQINVHVCVCVCVS